MHCAYLFQQQAHVDRISVRVAVSTSIPVREIGHEDREGQKVLITPLVPPPLTRRPRSSRPNPF